MALVLKDRVVESSTSSGTGTFTLNGAETGYQSFSVIGNGNTTYYTIEHPQTGEWEVGVGTYNANTLSRDTVLDSSNSGALVYFSSGQKNVFCDLPAEKVAPADSLGTMAYENSDNVSITGGVVNNTSQSKTTITDYESFTPTTAPSYAEGELWYDNTAHALAYYNDSANAIVHIGQDLQVKVINNTGSTIPNGSPVYVTSTLSGQTYPNIALAKADVASTASVIGLTNGAIANGAIGYVTSQGTIDNVNTGTFTVGQVLYLSPYSAGQLMNTIPPTGITVQVGVVSYVNSSTGKIYVKQTTPLAVPASIITGQVAIANGGTGASTASGARTNLGLGTIATQNANAVAITGGTIDGTSIGATTASTGTFTSLTATGTTTLATSLTGIAKITSGVVSTATSGTDYAPATSGTSILYGNGSGGFSNVTIGSNLTFSAGTLSAAAGMVYPSGTGIAVVTSGTSWGTTLTAPSGTIVGTTDTQTLTNKIITSRINSTASSSSITIAANTTDQYEVTALAVGTTFNAPTGSPSDGQKLTIRIKDNGTAQTLAWTGTSGGFRVVGVTLPTATVANKTFYIASIYNSADSFWDVISVAQQV